VIEAVAPTIVWLDLGVRGDLTDKFCYLGSILVSLIAGGLAAANKQKLAEEKHWDMLLARWWPAMANLAGAVWLWVLFGITAGVLRH
jgi:hypothetical protein